MVFGLFLFLFFFFFFFFLFFRCFFSSKKLSLYFMVKMEKCRLKFWKIWIFISWTCQLYLNLVFLYYYNLNIAVSNQFSIWNIIDRIKSRVSLQTDRQTDAIKMGEPPGFKNKPLCRNNLLMYILYHVQSMFRLFCDICR